MWTREGAPSAGVSSSFWMTAPVEAVEERLNAAPAIADPAVARSVRDRAAAFLMSNPARAESLAEALFAAVERAGSLASTETRAVAWRCRAESYLFTGQQRRARGAYEKATLEAERARDRQLLGEILVGRVGLLTQLGEPAAASRLARRAERLLTRTGDRAYLGKLHLNRGNTLFEQEKFAQAHTAFRQAYRVLEKSPAGNPVWAGLVMNLALTSVHLSRLEEAERLFVESEEHSQRHGLDLVWAQARFNRSFLEQLRGNYRDSLRLLADARHAFTRLASRADAATADRARSEIYLALGMPQEAIELARAAAEAFAGEGMAIDAAFAEVDEARALLAAGCAAEAIPLLEKARRFYAARRMRRRHAATRFHLAETHRQLGDRAQALRLATSALGAFELLGRPTWAARARRLIAEVHLDGGDARRANRTLEPALRRASALPAAERAELWAVAGRAALRIGDRRGAHRRLTVAARALEAQRRFIPGLEFRARSFERGVGVYHDLIDLALQGPATGAETLVPLVEAARARGFRDRLAGAGASTRRAIVEKRALLGSLTRRMEEDEFGDRSLAPGERQLMRQEIRALEREIIERIRRAEGLDPGGAEWRGGASVSEMRSRLRRGEAIVAYFVTGREILAIVLSRAGAWHRVLPAGRDAVEDLVQRVRLQSNSMALSAGAGRGSLVFQRAGADALLRALHDALVAPLAGWFPENGRLLVVPHSFLHQVPFECLHDGRGYIGDRWVVNRMPTIDWIFSRTSRRPRPGGEVLVSGTIASGPASAREEIEAVASHFSPDGTRVLLDPSADELLEAIPRARIFHMSAHGYFRDDNPLFSRLGTRDGGLFLADIGEQPLAAELVVLSACNAGQVFTGRGDDLVGVAHGFLAGGARWLVASLWRVHDEATTLLMDAFYRHLVDSAKGDPALALAKAARDVRSRWDHPFFWGSFSVHGA